MKNEGLFPKIVNVTGRRTLVQEDPLTAWRKKHAHQFSGWDATKAIRKIRNSRWNLS